VWCLTEPPIAGTVGDERSLVTDRTDGPP
jgi:hypothetical protein